METKIIVFGSSISAGCYDNEGGWVARISQDLNQHTNHKDSNFMGMVYNQSISGDTSTGILARFKPESKLRIGEKEKIFIVFEIGVNDSLYINKELKFQVPLTEFSSNIDQLVVQSKIADEVLFLGAPPVVDALLDPIPWHPVGTYATKYVKKFNQVLMSKCQEYQVKYCDIFSEFHKEDLNTLMSPDGVHPSTSGHEMYYQLMKSKLTKLGAFSTSLNS